MNASIIFWIQCSIFWSVVNVHDSIYVKFWGVFTLSEVDLWIIFFSLTCLRSYRSTHGCPDPQCSGAGAEPSFSTSVSPDGSSDAEEEAARRLYKHLAADGCILWYKGKCCLLTATVLLSFLLFFLYLKTFAVLDCDVSWLFQDRKSGRTALHMAAEEANVELLRLFLDQPDSLSVINAKVRQHLSWCQITLYMLAAKHSTSLGTQMNVLSNVMHVILASIIKAIDSFIVSSSVIFSNIQSWDTSLR